MSEKKILAIIPARGNSKRVPGKNILAFEGKPMIAWTIEAAKESGLFHKIVVSTDSEEIAETGRAYGAEVPFLRDDKADDHSPVSEATLRTIAQLEERGEFFDEVIQLFAVCPLRNAADIREAYDFYREKKAPFLISCYKYTWMNPWWAVTLDEENKPNWIFEKAEKIRSQDRPDLYSPTGAIWIGNISELKKEGSFYGKGHIFWEMNWKRAVDIDNYDDMKLASAFMRSENMPGRILKRSRQRKSLALNRIKD